MSVNGIEKGIEQVQFKSYDMMPKLLTALQKNAVGEPLDAGEEKSLRVLRKGSVFTTRQDKDTVEVVDANGERVSGAVAEALLELDRAEILAALNEELELMGLSPSVREDIIEPLISSFETADLSKLSDKQLEKLFEARWLILFHRKKTGERTAYLKTHKGRRFPWALEWVLEKAILRKVLGPWSLENLETPLSFQHGW